jgi:tetratricopeptide (TPR) repeat protein
MQSPARQLCPEERLEALLAAVRADERRGSTDLDALLRDYPEDARLHFLRGSLLAGRQDYSAARAAMRSAVDLAPDYGIARFQLGLLLLTSGEPHAAQEAWGPLHGLAADHPLKLFVVGLGHLIRDEFADAMRVLESGIARNRDNAPLNRDIQLIIDEVRALSSDARAGGTSGSSVDFLLQQAAMKATRH